MKFQAVSCIVYILAVCEVGCVNGGCDQPNICTCDVGWAGEQCDKGKKSSLK